MQRLKQKIETKVAIKVLTDNRVLIGIGAACLASFIIGAIIF